MGGEVDANRSAPRTTGNPEPAMPHLDTLISDRTGLLGAGGSLVAELPPTIIVTYLLLRLLVPVLLITVVSRGATPTQRISLVRTYLLSPPRHVRGHVSARRREGSTKTPSTKRDDASFEEAMAPTQDHAD
jgi:hypothetical protein